MREINVAGAVFEGGFLHNWLAYCSGYEFPQSYGLFALFAATSIAVGRRVLVNPGGEPEVWPNVYVVLMGPAGARKGAAMRRANRLLGSAVKLVGEHRWRVPVLPRTFTMEAAFNRLVKDSEEHGSGSGMIVSHEMKRLLGGDDYMLKNVDLLTDIWDCDDPFSRETIAHEYQEIAKPYLVLQAAAQPDLMEQRRAPEMFATGFLRRIVLIVEHGPKKFEADPPDRSVLFNALTRVFADRLSAAAAKPRLLPLSAEAMALKKDWYSRVVQPLWQRGSEKEGQFASCMEAHALKFGALVALLENDRLEQLEVGSLRVGQKLVEAILPNMFQAYAALAPTPYARLRAAYTRTVRAAGGTMEDGMLDKAILATTGARPDERAEVLQSLLDDGTLWVEGRSVKTK